ncbi:MAG: hypothetical protein HQM10_05430 [Candidatus Riflebacteria bacterium]|nr:hypothetical protein [Candidatus Riflebacteria bacterium]
MSVKTFVYLIILALTFSSSILSASEEINNPISDLINSGLSAAVGSLAPVISNVGDADKNSPISNDDCNLGYFEVTVDTLLEKTVNNFSKMAIRTEIWASDDPLACLNKGDPGVLELFRMRKFCFQKIPLPPGYHFITVKCFCEGFISRDIKWKSKTFQIHVSPGKTTKHSVTIPFFVW